MVECKGQVRGGPEEAVPANTKEAILLGLAIEWGAGLLYDIGMRRSEQLSEQRDVVRAVFPSPNPLSNHANKP